MSFPFSFPSPFQHFLIFYSLEDRDLVRSMCTRMKPFHSLFFAKGTKKGAFLSQRKFFIEVSDGVSLWVKERLDRFYNLSFNSCLISGHVTVTLLKNLLWLLTNFGMKLNFVAHWTRPIVIWPSLKASPSSPIPYPKHTFWYNSLTPILNIILFLVSCLCTHVDTLLSPFFSKWQIPLYPARPS